MYVSIIAYSIILRMWERVIRECGPLFALRVWLSESCGLLQVHYFCLNDINARGYIRQFCLSYVTADKKLVFFFLPASVKVLGALYTVANLRTTLRLWSKHSPW